MPTYRFGEGRVALANQQNHLSLYACGESYLKAYRSEHPEQKIGKGCVNFRTRDEIHFDDLEAVIQHAVEHPKS